jgi:hypothetical protein
LKNPSSSSSLRPLLLETRARGILTPQWDWIVFKLPNQLALDMQQTLPNPAKSRIQEAADDGFPSMLLGFPIAGLLSGHVDAWAHILEPTEPWWPAFKTGDGDLVLVDPTAFHVRMVQGSLSLNQQAMFNQWCRTNGMPKIRPYTKWSTNAWTVLFPSIQGLSNLDELKQSLVDEVPGVETIAFNLLFSED